MSTAIIFNIMVINNIHKYVMLVISQCWVTHCPLIYLPVKVLSSFLSFGLYTHYNVYCKYHLLCVFFLVFIYLVVQTDIFSWVIYHFPWLDVFSLLLCIPLLFSLKFKLYIFLYIPYYVPIGIWGIHKTKLLFIHRCSREQFVGTICFCNSDCLNGFFCFRNSMMQWQLVDHIQEIYYKIQIL